MPLMMESLETTRNRTPGLANFKMTTYEALQGFFRTRRLLFRAVENLDDDKAFFHNLLSDPINLAFSTVKLRRPATTNDSEDFIKLMQAAILGVMICLPPAEDSEADQEKPPATAPKPTPIGYLTFFPTAPGDVRQHRNAMIGISLADPFRGQGYGLEAINWGLDWAFKFGGMHRVSLIGFSYNDRALKLYRKMGFVDEGREREAIYHDRGWHDMIIMGMLEHEWEKLRCT